MQPINSFIKTVWHRAGALLQMTPVDEITMTKGEKSLCLDKVTPEQLYFFSGPHASFAAYEETPQTQRAAEEFCTKLANCNEAVYDRGVLEIIIDGSRQILSRAPAKFILSWTTSLPASSGGTKVAYRSRDLLLVITAEYGMQLRAHLEVPSFGGPSFRSVATLAKNATWIKTATSEDSLENRARDLAEWIQAHWSDILALAI